MRLEKLFDLGEHILGDALQIASVLDFTDLVRHCAPDLFAGRHRRSGNRVRLFETYAHPPQVGAAGAAVLGRLTFFGSTAWTKHSRWVIRTRSVSSSASSSIPGRV